MTVHLLYFAAVRDLVARESEDVELPADVRTVADLSVWLGGRYPSLSSHLPSIRFAVDEVFSDPLTSLSEGSTVALIPPVAGG